MLGMPLFSKVLVKWSHMHLSEYQILHGKFVRYISGFAIIQAHVWYVAGPLVNCIAVPHDALVNFMCAIAFQSQSQGWSHYAITSYSSWDFKGHAMKLHEFRTRSLAKHHRAVQFVRILALNALTVAPLVNFLCVISVKFQAAECSCGMGIIHCGVVKHFM